MAGSTAGWRGRRVFITGHTGFKGGWLAWWLHGLGAQLTGYALAAPTRPSLYDVAGVGNAFVKQHMADVRDAARLHDALHAAQPEVVFHLAAQPLVRASYQAPLDTLATNVMGTAHLLEAARSCTCVRAVVVVTSDKCYREQATPHVEGDALGGHDPYSASKACAELVASSYCQAYQLPQRGLGVATARAGNVVGGGDWTADRLLPDVLRAIDSGAAVRLRHPAAVRPWQHVLEPLAGYMALAEQLLADPCGFSGAWNFGPGAGQEQPVAAVVARLLTLAADSGVRVCPAQPDPQDGALHEAPVLRLDASKAQQRLGWQGRLGLADTLRLTWQWQQAWRRGADMRKITCEQIDAYRALMPTTLTHEFN